jgi:cell division protein FtsL
MRSVGSVLMWEYWRKRKWYIVFNLLVLVMMCYITGLRIKHAEKRYLQIKEHYQNLKIEDSDDYQWAKKQLEENIRQYKSSVNEIYHFFLFYFIFPLGSIMICDTKKNKIRLPERLFTLPITTNSLVARIFLYEIISVLLQKSCYDLGSKA